MQETLRGGLIDSSATLCGYRSDRVHLSERMVKVETPEPEVE